MRRRQRRAQAGFSVIEALAAAAILGVALVGVVKLHGSSIRGTAKAERIGRASEVARQFAELLATTTRDNLPACGPGLGAAPPVPAVGCKNGPGVSTAFSPERAVGCTLFIQDGPSTPSINQANAANGINNQIINIPAAIGIQPSQFRVDIMVSGHPNTADFPQAALLTVWACWRDELGIVNEVRTRRILY